MNVIKQIVNDGEYGAQTIKMIVKDNERGPQGEQGEQGTAATIEAGQVYPVEEGQQAVINTGTSSNAVFDFYLPKGPKGDDGAIKYTAGTGIKITDGNVIEATGEATAAWGGIQGDITDQADLQNEFAEYTKTADLPAINDATLTIQNNGTNVATFTANSATNTTANIVPPVQIGSVLSTPTDIDYVSTNNIQTGAVTASKFAQYAVNSAILTADNLTPSADTPEAWVSLLGGDGYYVTQYDIAGKFTNQPDQYGQLETFISGTHVYQRFSQDMSIEWHRGADSSDWNIYSSGEFRLVFDDRTARIGKGPIIPTGTDLNTTTYIIPRDYTGTPGTYTNCPTTAGFSLTVQNIGRQLRLDATTQNASLIRILISRDGDIWTQHVHSDSTPTWTFGTWRKVAWA